MLSGNLNYNLWILCVCVFSFLCFCTKSKQTYFTAFQHEQPQLQRLNIVFEETKAKGTKASRIEEDNINKLWRATKKKRFLKQIKRSNWFSNYKQNINKAKWNTRESTSCWWKIEREKNKHKIASASETWLVFISSLVLHFLPIGKYKICNLTNILWLDEWM